jgi:F-type H+-transporting ATPase subunit a
VNPHLVLASDFHAPNTGDFVFTPLFGKGTFFTVPMLVAILAAVVVGGFFYLAARRSSMVPGKMQFAGEMVYGFVRNSIAHEAIGARAAAFVPYLVTLFGFVFVMNICGIIPFIQFPGTSKFAFPLFLAVISCLTFNVVGIRRQGFKRYFGEMMFPPGIPWWVYILLAPLEFLSTVVIRPITLTLRLQLNMFAGHLVLALSVVGGAYLLRQGGGLAVASPIGFVFGVILTFFEGFIQFLQAYVFVLLSALYIGGALADGH